MEEVYTSQQVADRYGVEKITVLDWIRKKKLTAFKVGKSYFVSKRDIEAFEEAGRTL